MAGSGLGDGFLMGGRRKKGDEREGVGWRFGVRRQRDTLRLGLARIQSGWRHREARAVVSAGTGAEVRPAGSECSGLGGRVTPAPGEYYSASDNSAVVPRTASSSTDLSAWPWTGLRTLKLETGILGLHKPVCRRHAELHRPRNAARRQAHHNSLELRSIVPSPTHTPPDL